jgi:hypothetical protein
VTLRIIHRYLNRRVVSCVPVRAACVLVCRKIWARAREEPYLNRRVVSCVPVRVRAACVLVCRKIWARGP